MATNKMSKKQEDRKKLEVIANRLENLRQEVKEVDDELDELYAKGLAIIEKGKTKK